MATLKGTLCDSLVLGCTPNTSHGNVGLIDRLILNPFRVNGLANPAKLVPKSTYAKYGKFFSQRRSAC